MWGFAPGYAATVKDDLQGGVTGTAGARVRPDGQLTFEADDAQLDPTTGYGTVRYAGTIVSFPRFHLVEIALANPWIEFTADGSYLSAETSTANTVRDDDVTRTWIARLDVDADSARTSFTGVNGRFEFPLDQPTALLPYSGQQIAPLGFSYLTLSH